jgi:hypothetical protein
MLTELAAREMFAETMQAFIDKRFDAFVKSRFPATAGTFVLSEPLERLGFPLLNPFSRLIDSSLGVTHGHKRAAAGSRPELRSGRGVRLDALWRKQNLPDRWRWLGWPGHAYRLLERFPKAQVTVLEKEATVGAQKHS